MGLNYLLHRHQVSLMRAQAAPTLDVKRVHQAFVEAYAAKVDAEGEVAGATAAPLVRC